MALKQIMLQRKIDLKKSELEELRKGDEDFQKREAELETAISEANTEEEQSTIEEEVEKFTSEKEERSKKIDGLETELRSMAEEMTKLNENEPKAKQTEEARGMDKVTETREGKMNYAERSDVKGFYTELRDRLHLRASGNVLPAGEAGAELVIPEIIVQRIRERIGDFTTLYPLVDKINAKGKVKLILDVDAGEATWLEQRGALPEDDDTSLTSVEFDGFKIGRIVYLDNSLLEDSIINLDDYLTKRIARSIAKGLDKAIVSGEGKEKKQPEGILTKVPTANKVTAEPTYEALIPTLGLIDSGEDASGEIVAVVHRQTYYSKLATLTLHTDSAGKDVVTLPVLSQPNFLGLRVVFNNYVPKDHIVFGDYSQYTLVEREAARVDMSGDYKFREDQTAIRGLGRYDGKPVKPAAFVDVTLAPKA